MDSIPPNPILEFNPNQMIEVRKLYDYDDLNRLHQDINILQDWIKKQQHFLIREYDETYLERLLICSKGSIERAKKRIDKLCTLRGLMPEYLQGLDIEHEFKNLLVVTQTCLLPKPTPDYYRIFYTNFCNNPDATLYDIKKMARYLLLIVEYCVRHDYCAGIEIVCDITNITFGIVSSLNLIVIHNCLMIITEAIGFRIKGLHFISGGSKLLDTVLAIVKGALSKKLNSRIHAHENHESLYKMIPKDRFPKDVGGDLPLSLKEISENTIKEFSSPAFVNKMKYIEGAVTDETKRLITKFNEDYSGMPGSFKVLSVD